MAIYRLLKDTTFEPEAVEVMGRAYEDLLADLRLADCMTRSRKSSRKRL